MSNISNPSTTSSAATSILPYTFGLDGVSIPVDDTVTHILWLSIAALCLVILVGRFGQMANAHLRHLLSLGAREQQQAYWSEDRTSMWPKLKKHLLYAPLYKKRHNMEMRLSSALNVGTLPSRLHSTILLAYLISNVIYCILLDYSQPKPALVAEIRGRTGHLSLVNMVPLIVLAGRNNPFIYLLRVSFDTYNLFHRWIGRVVILEAIAHTIAWAWNEIAAKGHQGANAQLTGSPFLVAGLVGTVAFSVILLQSLSAVRHAFYETFLHIHQFLALAAIVAVWVHCNLGDLPGSSYIRWALALWICDRAARMFRIVYRNVSRRGLTKVTVEALPGDTGLEACRVSFKLARPWKYTPGCHAYIYLPSLSLWMNHPFSIAWSDSTLTPYLALDDEKLPTSKSDLDCPLPLRTSTTIYFVIAKRTGVTATLYDKARASPTGIITMSGLVEGPYGGLDSLHSYGTVILFAAGIGITHQLGHVRDLLHGHQAVTVATRKIVLVWSVKNTATLEWVRPWMDEILRLPNRKLVLTVMLFVTRPRSAREVVSRSETVLMFPGRCDPRVVLAKEMERRVGAVSVTVCGPGAFADDVRGAVRDVVGEGTVDFVEEAFTW